MDENLQPARDVGILRRQEDDEEELLLFGYSCKIFDDYDSSVAIEQGKHLISWVGDENIKIDRYDCRSEMTDVSAYLQNSAEDFTPEEKRIEQLCDEERYRALTVNEEDEILYQEEELKRLQQALNDDGTYSEVAYNYEGDEEAAPVQEQPQLIEEEMNIDEEDEEPFIPPFQLDVPVGMIVPKNRKHHEIIEKTAMFINSQGPQMEIILKMKQADNPQFDFLSFDNELHPYYRQVLMAVKTQRYRPVEAVASQKAESTTDEVPAPEENTENISMNILPESAPVIPNINYKPSEDCAYSTLVNRIKGSQGVENQLSFLENLKKKREEKLKEEKAEANRNRIKTLLEEKSIQIVDKPRPISPVMLDSLTKSARRRYFRKERNRAAANAYKVYYVENAGDSEDFEKEASVKSDEEVEIEEALKPIPPPAPVKVPPAEIQVIVDKMASYVAKNGRDFEDVVRKKGDKRFSFLDPAHVYNPYYNQKVELYLQLEQMSAVADTKKTSNHVVEDESESQQATAPICFAIKKPKDQESLDNKSALPYEESEPEDEEKEEKDDSPERVVELVRDEPQSEPERPIDSKKSEYLEKWAEERVRAKLVTAAKEKLAAKERDKQLQAERRKKAADFIHSLHKESLVNKFLMAENAKNITNFYEKSDEVSTVATSQSNSVVSLMSDDDEAIFPKTDNDEDSSRKRKKLKHKRSDSKQSSSRRKKEKRKKRKKKHYRSSPGVSKKKKKSSRVDEIIDLSDYSDSSSSSDS